MGAETDIAYASATDLAKAAQDAHTPWKRPLPVAAQVVKTITTDNGVAGAFHQSRTVEYSYADPVWDVRDREFLGFEQVTSTEVGEPTPPGAQSPSPGRQVRTTFLTRTCPEADAHQPCPPATDYAFRATRGLPGAVEVLDQAGSTHLVSTIHAYSRSPRYLGLDGRQVRSVRERETLTIIWDPERQTTVSSIVDLMPGDPSPEPLPKPPVFATITVDMPGASDPAKKQLLRTADYDAFGNPLTLVRGEIDAGSTFVASPIVDKFDWEQVEPETPATAQSVLTGWTWRPTSHAIGYGDGRGKLVKKPARETHFAWNRAGLLEQVSANLNGTVPLFRQNGASSVAPPPAEASVDGPVTLAVMSYGAFGNMVRAETPNGRCSGISYDAAYQQLPIATQEWRAGCLSPDPLETTREFDRGLSAVVRETAPDTTVMGVRYDGFGRLIEIDQPDAVTLGQVSPFPSVIVDWSLADKGPIPKVHTRRISGSGASPTYAETWTYVDSLGETLATISQGDTPDTWIATGMTARSVNGRMLRAFEPAPLSGNDGSAFELTPPPLAVSVTYDALGRLLSTTDLDGATTTYEQLRFQVTVRDPEQQPGGAHAGSFTILNSDAFGRRVSIIQNFANDPKDTITTKMGYEASGELLEVVRSHSGSGAAIFQQFTYDSLGRRVRSAEENTEILRSVGPGTIVPESRAYAYNDNGDLVGTSDARGCGENISYDRLGRLVAEDYSPCAGTNSIYSPPNLATGEGVERLNVYDIPAAPTGTSDDQIYRGKLTQTFDLAQKSDVVLDARGRTILVRRQISLPDARSKPFAQRYAPRIYQQEALAFDEANRTLTRTTGARTAELRPPNVGSSITTNYTVRGNIQSVTSTYGALVAKQIFDSFDALSARFMADAAQTIVKASYNDNRTLKTFGITRRAGPWLPSGPTYFPPELQRAEHVAGDSGGPHFHV